MESQWALHGGADDSRPSLFELISEQQLHDLLPPCLRYLLALAAHRHPRLFLRALNSFDELYAALDLAVQAYYLRVFRGSFTEHFYALKRERAPSLRHGHGGEFLRAQRGAPPHLVRDALALDRRDIWMNLAVIVGVPYIRRKLDEDYDVLVAPQASLVGTSNGGGGGGGGGPRHSLDATTHFLSPPHATVRQRFLHYYKWFLSAVYPFVNAAYHFALLAFSLGYLFNNTKYASPFLWLLGTRVRRLGAADYAAIDVALQPSPYPSSASTMKADAGSRRSFLGSRILGLLLTSPRKIYPLILRSLKLLLPTSIFALRFLEWWHASDFSRLLFRKANEDAPRLPPPVVSGMSMDMGMDTDGPFYRQNDKISEAKKNEDKKSEKQPIADITAPSRPRSAPPISSTTSLPILVVPYPALRPPAADTSTSSSTSPSTSPPSASPDDPRLCPICLNPITTPTACQTGYVFCYACVFRWVSAEHPRQERFLSGGGGGAAVGAAVVAWDAVDGALVDAVRRDGGGGGRGDGRQEKRGSTPTIATTRETEWESGRGRCPVTGRRLLGGTDGLRRLLV